MSKDLTIRHFEERARNDYRAAKISEACTVPPMGRAVVADGRLEALRNVAKLVCDVWVVREEDSNARGGIPVNSRLGGKNSRLSQNNSRLRAPILLGQSIDIIYLF